MSYDDPVDEDEWRAVALLARGALLLDAARRYGLVSGGPAINVPRCEELVARAKARGIEIDDHEAARAFMVDIASGAAA